MEELNTLISPCKKLRLESPTKDDLGTSDAGPDVNTSSHVGTVCGETVDDQTVVRAVMRGEAVGGEAINGEVFCGDDVIGLSIDNDEPICLFQTQISDQVRCKVPESKTQTESNGSYKSSQNNEPNSGPFYSTNATSMLINSNDHVEDQIDNKYEGTVKCSAELLPKTNDDVLPQNETNEITDMLVDSHASSTSETEIEEIFNVQLHRQYEVMNLCSGVKVSAIIEQMESGKTVNTNDNNSNVNAQSQFNIIETVAESSDGSENDKLNVSERTLVDELGEECCTERLEISGASECENDAVVHGNDLPEHPNNLSNEHVYAKVIVNVSSPENIDKAYQPKVKPAHKNLNICPMSDSDPNAQLFNNDYRRSSGDGAEVLEDTGKYFSIVDDDSDSDIGADGVEVEEETTNYFCNFEGIQNHVNSHYLYNIKEEENAGYEAGVHSTIITADRLNNTEIELTRTISHGQADPLCASTPLPSKSDLHSLENESYQLPLLNSFKPAVNSTTNLKPVDRNSRPLLTSTPLLKPYQGLKVRDMNIMPTDDTLIGKSKYTNVFGIDQKREENVIGSVDIINVDAGDDIGTKPKAVRRHSFSDQTFQRNRHRDSKREKKRNKGVRKEKFKEYMGPGLTVGISTEEVSDVNSGIPKKDFVKNSDIETCTLIEYKGFGLTGPLPDKPLHASTPMHSILENEIKSAGTQNMNGPGSSEKPSMKRCLSGLNLGGRPAGTEGMLVPSTKTEIPKLRQTVSETRFGQKMVTGPADLRRKTLTRHNSDLGPQSHSKHSRLTGWLAQVQAHRPHALLPPLVEGHPLPVLSVPLKPDEVYPGMVSVPTSASSSIGGSSKTEKSESNSNTDKSDKSDKVQLIDPAVLHSQGIQGLKHNYYKWRQFGDRTRRQTYFI